MRLHTQVNVSRNHPINYFSLYAKSGLQYLTLSSHDHQMLHLTKYFFKIFKDLCTENGGKLPNIKATGKKKFQYFKFKPA